MIFQLNYHVRNPDYFPTPRIGIMADMKDTIPGAPVSPSPGKTHAYGMIVVTFAASVESMTDSDKPIESVGYDWDYDVIWYDPKQPDDKHLFKFRKVQHFREFRLTLAEVVHGNLFRFRQIPWQEQDIFVPELSRELTGYLASCQHEYNRRFNLSSVPRIQNPWVELDALKAELVLAAEKEEFERCASLRDRIRGLEKELRAGK